MNLDIMKHCPVRRAFLLLALSCVLPAMAGVRWLETRHDFGAFNESDGEARCEFRFVNDGPEDVAVVGARANCGCTTPEYSRDPIAPGDTAVISVAYDPTARPGRFTKYVQVDVSGEGAPQRLTLTGVVIGEPSSVGARFPVECGPLRLRRGALMLGKVAKGRLKTGTTEVYNATADSLCPVVEGVVPYLDATFVPEVIGPGEQATMMVYFRSDRTKLYGLVSHTLNIAAQPVGDAAGDSITAGCELPVTAWVEEDFGELTDSRLAKAPAAKLGAPAVELAPGIDGLLTGTVTLKNSGKSALHIRRIYTTDPGVDISYKTDVVKPGKHVEVHFTVDPGRWTGPTVDAKIQVITDDPLNAVQTLRLVGLRP